VGIQLDREMERLQNELIDLGSIVEHTITESVEILEKRRVRQAQLLIEADSEINRRRFSIEWDALILMARRQPMARDLRTLATTLHIASELERIADYSKGIAKISIQLGSSPLIELIVDIPQMAELASGMLHKALLSFIDRDVDAAHSIVPEDGKINDLYGQVYRQLMTYVFADPKNIYGASHLIWVAHNLERAADRAVKIGWRVIFAVTGEMTKSKH